VETLKLDNQVAVPLAPRAAYRGRGGGRRPCSVPESGEPHVTPPLPKDATLRRGYLLLSYGVAKGGRDEAADASLLQPLYPLPQIAASIKTTPPTPTVAAASPRV